MNPLAKMGRSLAKNVPTLIASAMASVSDHAPQVLMGIGTGGVVATGAACLRAGLRIGDILKTPEFLHDLQEAEDSEKKTKVIGTYIRWVGPEMVVPAILGGLTIGSFWGAHHIQNQRSSKLAAALVTAEGMVATYQDAITDTLEEGAKTAQEAVVKQDKKTFEDIAEKASLEYDFLPGTGDQVFIDGVTGFACRNTEENIIQAEKWVVEQINDGNAAHVNDFYEQMGIEYFGIVGGLLGWSKDTKPPHVTFGAKYVKNGHPISVLHYNAQVVDAYGVPFSNVTGIENTSHGLVLME